MITQQNQRTNVDEFAILAEEKRNADEKIIKA